MPRGQGYAGVPPGPLSAYLGVQDASRQQDMAGLGLLQRMQEAQETRKLRETLATQSDIRQRELAQIASADRRAQMELTGEIAKGRLQQAANQLEMQNQFNRSRIDLLKDEGERKRQADEWQRTYERGQLEIKQQLLEMKAIPGDQPLKAPELLHYVDPEGNHPPVGSTLNDVIKKGFRLASTQEVNMLLAGRGAESTVNQLDKYVTSIWGKEGTDTITEGLTRRGSAAANFAIDRARQSNPDLNAYESFAKGTLAPLIRAIGEKGALSDKDIERALNLVPKTGDKLGEFPDTSVVARQKMQQLRQWFTNALGKSPKAIIPGEAEISGPKEGDKSQSKSGKAMIFRNGRWEYE